MKSIHFKQSWREAIAQFDAAVRCEIYGATVAYSLEGIVPESMSDLARGAFAFIKAEIDASRRRAEKARATRMGHSAEPAPQTVEIKPETESDVRPDAEPEPIPPKPSGPVLRAGTGPCPPARRLRPAPKPQPRPTPRRTFIRSVERRIRRLNFA